jgi:hypothetical protein
MLMLTMSRLKTRQVQTREARVYENINSFCDLVKEGFSFHMSASKVGLRWEADRTLILNHPKAKTLYVDYIKRDKRHKCSR